MRRIAAAVVVLCLVGMSAGCMGRALREGAGLALGAKTNVVEINSLNTARPIGPVNVGSIDNAMGRPVTSDWPAALNAQLRARVSQEKEFAAAGRLPVDVSGTVVHLEGAGLMDQAFGPAPEVIVRMTVKDASTGAVLGVANVIGRARGTTSSSQEDLTKAFAEGVVKWLRKADGR